MSTVHPLLTMKWHIQKRFLIMTWHMIHSNCVHLHVFTWLVKVWMFWVCPPSIQVCPLSFQICLLSIHCWLWNETFRKDSWLWPGTCSTVTVYIYTYLPGWSRFECFGFAHCPSRFVHCPSRFAHCPSRFVHCLSRYIYCPFTVDYEMKHSEMILDYDLVQWLLDFDIFMTTFSY